MVKEVREVSVVGVRVSDLVRCKHRKKLPEQAAGSGLARQLRFFRKPRDAIEVMAAHPEPDNSLKC